LLIILGIVVGLPLLCCLGVGGCMVLTPGGVRSAIQGADDGFNKRK
jgi:hypothetical protein